MAAQGERPAEVAPERGRIRVRLTSIWSADAHSSKTDVTIDL